MKKLIAMMCALSFIVTIGVTAFAAEVGTGSTESITRREVRENKLNKWVKRKVQVNKEEIEEILAKVTEYNDTLEVNRDQNKALREENRGLRKELVSYLKPIKDNGETLDPETKELLKAYFNNLKDIRKGLKDTKGDMKEVVKGYRDIEELDEAAIESLCSEIEEIQLSRYTEISKVNEILTEMIRLLQ